MLDLNLFRYFHVPDVSPSLYAQLPHRWSLQVRRLQVTHRTITRLENYALDTIAPMFRAVKMLDLSERTCWL